MVYIPVELKREIRKKFANCCAYCRTAEDLTVTIAVFISVRYSFKSQNL
jgi:hypothetical protein